MLYSAAYTSTLLLHYALPACGGSDDDRRRVLAGGAVLATGAQALPRLFPHGLTAPGAAAAGVEAAAQLHSQAAAYHLTLSQLLDGMWRALRLPELPPQLQRPQSLHVWLRDVLGAMQPVKGSVLMGAWNGQTQMSVLWWCLVPAPLQSWARGARSAESWVASVVPAAERTQIALLGAPLPGSLLCSSSWTLRQLASPGAHPPCRAWLLVSSQPLPRLPGRPGRTRRAAGGSHGRRLRRP